MSKELSIPEKMNSIVNNVLTQDKIDGFQKAYVVATGIQDLRNILTPEYMKPIMALMNNKLGFKTDLPNYKNPNKFYSEKEVKECLIEAVFMGLQPYGNEFNIIAGNCYPTKEGLGALLSKFKGLKYEIIPGLPKTSGETSVVTMGIYWSLNGGKQESRSLDIPIRVNKAMGNDAVIGKATRKARAWLYGTITGSEIVDGDVDEVPFVEVTDVESDEVTELQPEKNINGGQDLEMRNRLKKYLLDCNDIKTLENVFNHAEELLLLDEYQEAKKRIESNAK
jgi:hypothetical protein